MSPRFFTPRHRQYRKPRDWTFTKSLDAIAIPLILQGSTPESAYRAALWGTPNKIGTPRRRPGSETCGKRNPDRCRVDSAQADLFAWRKAA